LIRTAINGYGRIGRSVLRALYESKGCEKIRVVAINEPADCKTIAHLTKYDSTHGRFPGSVELTDDVLTVNGDAISVFHSEDIQQLPWAELDIDVVLECSGTFTDRETAEQHLSAGAKKVVFSQPAESTVDATIVMGVNEQSLSGEETIISNASCSTNCVVPVIKTLHEAFDIEGGVITTIHSAMNDQPVIDLSVLLKTEVDITAVNQVLQQAADGPLAGILGYTEEPLASCDFNHDPRSGIVDASQTRVSQKRLVKVLIWFDNEWGYANRMVELVTHWLT
jgi:glyceraldehyde-3-phosphate dehydrogenase/erythrose-4-phosphate dehydrogenase